MSKSVAVIPATKRLHSNENINQKIKRRVAAYARVSTDSEEQLTSYEAQVDYYTKLIKRNGDWEFVGVYTDEGISATNTKYRDGFNRMVQDAMDGKIDLIITKSVSRFARNTVDSLVTVRELKANNVEVYFEKENIYTFDGKGELLITIMSSLAQEESRSISENVTWGCRKRFADGKVSMPYSAFLGYEKGEDGQPKIVESEARIVRLIYKMFLEGKTPTYIAKYLTGENIPTPTGRSKWSVSTVESILRNEKYKGSALLQKTFTVDFLSKKKKVNEGEIPQYYVEDSHPAIISKEVYDLAQIELDKRRQNKGYKSSASAFSGKLYCGECGSVYGSKVWHSNLKYRRTIWQCNAKFKNEHKCQTPHLTEDMLKSAYIDVFNSLIDNREEIISVIRQTIEKLMDTTAIDKKLFMAKNAADNKLKTVQEYMALNGKVVIDQKVYNEKFDRLMEIYQKAEDEYTRIKREKTELTNRCKRCNAFISTLGSSCVLQGFDEGLFCGTVEQITVFENRLEFEFKDGTIFPYLLTNK